MGLRVLEYSSDEDRLAIEALVERLRSQVADSGDIADVVGGIIEDVRQRGDEALVAQARRWTNPQFTADMIQVGAEQMAAAEAGLNEVTRTALSRSIANVRAYQQHIKPVDPQTITLDGCELGMRFTPIEKVGLCVPGGMAAYPSTLIMTAVPAQVAGVKEISVICPPPTGGDAGADVSELVLAVAHMLGIERVYRIGGPSAIAALVYGTESVEPVDFIAGPGNAFTQQAKRQLFGMIGIDGFFGPSEIVLLADESANPQWVASDLIAQAEHDPGCCFLVSKSAAVIGKINEAIAEQLPLRKRRGAIEKALADWSAAIVVPDDATAYEVMDQIAAEHVTLATSDPYATLENVKNGGAWFLGDASPVASGDYYAGPSHCLPTSSTARYTSGLSAYTFMKRSSVEHYPNGPGKQTAADIAHLAEAEGLDAHAYSVRVRRTPE